MLFGGDLVGVWKVWGKLLLMFCGRVGSMCAMFVEPSWDVFRQFGGGNCWGNLGREVSVEVSFEVSFEAIWDVK